jgi:hypothetical protein
MIDPAGQIRSARFDRGDAPEAIAGAVASAASGSGAVIVVGAATGLDEEVETHAAHAGLAVLRARASEDTSGTSFGVARQLFAPAVERLGKVRRARVLKGAAGLAAPLLDGEEGPERDLTAIHGLYWLASNLADLRPLALVVEDAEWADAASLRLFTYLAQRIDELPVALVLATASGAFDVLAVRD